MQETYLLLVWQLSRFETASTSKPLNVTRVMMKPKRCFMMDCFVLSNYRSLEKKKVRILIFSKRLSHGWHFFDRWYNQLAQCIELSRAKLVKTNTVGGVQLLEIPTWMDIQQHFFCLSFFIHFSVVIFVGLGSYL